MPTYLQADRPLSVTTPLPADALRLTGLRGHEAISSLFHYDFDLLAENGAAVPFDALLGRRRRRKSSSRIRRRASFPESSAGCRKAGRATISRTTGWRWCP